MATYFSNLEIFFSKGAPPMGVGIISLNFLPKSSMDIEKVSKKNNNNKFPKFHYPIPKPDFERICVKFPKWENIHKP